MSQPDSQVAASEAQGQAFSQDLHLQLAAATDVPQLEAEVVLPASALSVDSILEASIELMTGVISTTSEPCTELAPPTIQLPPFESP